MIARSSAENDAAQVDAIARIADKWVIAVAAALADGEAMRFADLSRQVAGISQKMLSRTLTRMAEDGLVVRTAHRGTPARIDYRLTDIGQALATASAPLRHWAQTRDAGDPVSTSRETGATMLPASTSLSRAMITRHIDAGTAIENVTPTAMPDLHLMRVEHPRELVRGVYKPVVCFVIAGGKQATTPEKTIDVHAGDYFLIQADRPVAGRVLHATPEAPFLAAYIDLDMALMQAVSVAAPSLATDPAREADARIGVADCVRRLLILLDRPEARAMLHDGTLRELYYWLLAGRYGDTLRDFARPGGPAQQIGAAIAMLRADYARPLSVERLAATAGMGTTAFHHHFKAITLLSPMQFQKQLRLVEARRLMTVDNASGKTAAHRVGYASLSQFSREYRRLFGEPPRRHATGLPPSEPIEAPDAPEDQAVIPDFPA